MYWHDFDDLYDGDYDDGDNDDGDYDDGDFDGDYDDGDAGEAEAAGQLHRRKSEDRCWLGLDGRFVTHWNILRDFFIEDRDD